MLNQILEHPQRRGKGTVANGGYGNMNVRIKMVCEHEPECSAQDSYCRTGEFTELLDETGTITQIIMPDDAPKDCFYVCACCGAEARLVEKAAIPEFSRQESIEV